MSLRAKIITIVAALMAFFVCLDFGIHFFLVYPKFLALEQAATRRNMERCIEALSREIHHLDALCHDWSAWDDTCDFVTNQNPEYVNSNLVASTFINNNLNMIYILNREGEVVWGEVYDLKTGKHLQTDEIYMDSFSLSNPLLAHNAIDSAITGVYMMEKGPMIISSRPIVTSSEEGPIQGVMVMGRMLNKSLINTIAEQTRVSLQISTVESDLLTADRLGLLENFTAVTPFVIEPTGEDLIVHAVFPDINGQPALLLQARVERDISEQGLIATRIAIFIFLLAGLGALIALVLLISRILTSPIRRLTANVVAVGQGHAVSLNRSMKRKDEIGALAREFDHMVKQLGETQQKLLDKSYSSGAAEMASGVLHNIRNALGPIVGQADYIRHAIRKTPIDKIEAAQRELAEGNTSPERRKDLACLLELLTKRLVELVWEMTRELDGIFEQAMRIEEILGEHERFSHANRIILPLRLDDLFREGIKLTPPILLQGISINIDDSIQKMDPVLGQRFLLIQVFGSVITNAAESIQQADIENGKITIHADIEEKDDRSMIHIRVQDNGKGMEKDSFGRIFERGFSTKGKSNSGLGLHWCANAIADLDGRIYAENLESDQGAGLHIIIPKATESLHSLLRVNV